jgi:hypothetical protein
MEKRQSYAWALGALALGLVSSSFAQDLPREKIVLKSAIKVDLQNRFVRLPLRRGLHNGQTVWFVLTDVSDETLATKIGLNFAPKLANVGRGCPGCVQVLDIPPDITQASSVNFLGSPDFSPTRIVIPGPTGFPLKAAQPGARAGLFYTPYVQAAGTKVVYNAPIVASGEPPFDIGNHSDVHDRVVGIDPVGMTVDLLFIQAFSAGKEVIYLGLDSSSADSAVLERATHTPVLEGLAFPNGAFRKGSARAALFAFANGQTGPLSPPAQGLNHLVIDGHITEEASLSNLALLDALRRGGDARNVIDVFPTELDPRLRLEYSPAWDLHLTVWSQPAVEQGLNFARTDSNVVRLLGTQNLVTSPGGLPLRSANIEVNCPVVAFVNDPPLQPVIPPPFPLPLPFYPFFGG